MTTYGAGTYGAGTYGTPEGRVLVNYWSFHTSTACDPRGLAVDPLREVISRQTIDGSRYDVLSCGHRFPAADGCRVSDGRKMRRCPLDYDDDDH